MIQAGIVGFRGYSGAELLRLLARHPRVNARRMEHRADAAPELQPRHATVPNTVAATPEAAVAAGLDVVFLATPHDVSMELTPALLAAGIRVVDLSGAFRLREPEIHKRWYGDDHSAEDLLRNAVYGLPEFYRDRIAGAKFVSNPGCYPTAANLALRPLVQNHLVDRSMPIVCDAKSGVSGAGRKASLKTSFCEAGDNFSVYSAFGHRHVPEVLQNSGLTENEFHFVAQLLPTPRGILETIYLRLREGAGKDDVLAAYDEAYRSEPFVRVYNPGQFPDLHAVQHTNFCDIGFQFEEASRMLVVVAVEDNLVKGAAGQAVQNMNLMFGFAETEGLL
ncbi:MAG: N-acetyl-gamma-glutamyl-phosphate reductase [Bryobacterales bacterium]|nr:N-acetyl-gamma-glutamyl-phosphate reductase [Bryobacterales bacterium]